jgi:protein-L-isoaspartate(D-aspartate) O-methyltransferase
MLECRNELDRLTHQLRQALAAAGVCDQRLLDAFCSTPREGFVPPEWAARSDEDVPLPIPHGQVTTQPSLIAKMLEAVALQDGERALEIGTGYGFQTALLAKLAGQVWSVERWPDLAQRARDNLARAGIENAHVEVGDGTEGLAARSPFDVIVVAAAFPAVPSPLSEQLAERGRLVQPIGPGGREDVGLFVKRHGQLRHEALVTKAHFVRLVGKHGFREP